jgi:hypothetical protein
LDKKNLNLLVLVGFVISPIVTSFLDSVLGPQEF